MYTAEHPELCPDQLLCHNRRRTVSLDKRRIGLSRSLHERSGTMTEREQLEYSALRATIRERGTARVCIFAAGIAAWGALTVATAALASTPLGSLLPLLVLAAVFEAVFALHGNGAAPAHGRRWEPAAMSFGRPRGAVNVDALFALVFLLAALFNLAPA